MDPLLLILLVLLLVGGGWGYRSDWGGSQYGGLVGVLLLILLILFLTGHLGRGRL
jgi:hypothetical protein